MKPTVIIAADTYYPKVDGVLSFMEEFVKRTPRDLSLHLLVPKFSTVRKEDVPVTFLDLSRRGLFTYNSIQFSRKNRQKIRAAVNQADIVFIQELGPVGILALRAAQASGKKVVMYIHNTPWEFLEKHYSLNRLTSFLLKKLFVHWYNQAELLLIPYPQLEPELRRAGVNTAIQVARLGVDLEKCFPAQNKIAAKEKLHLPPKPVVGYVGRVSKEKNTLLLREAFTRLQVEAFLLIVGDGQPELVKKFQQTENCRVTGFVSNVQDYLKAMDLFVMPSLTETTSLATLEAMATGLPVIVTKVGFMKKYIRPGRNGLFCPRNSPVTLARKIEYLLTNPKFCARLGEQARRTAAAFSWEKSVKKITQHLLALALK